ncbi:metal-dependent hydrolase [Pseudonocardia benzenivorans]
MISAVAVPGSWSQPPTASAPRMARRSVSSLMIGQPAAAPPGAPDDPCTPAPHRLERRPGAGPASRGSGGTRVLGVSHALSGAAVGLAVMGVAGAGVVSGWAAGHVAAAPVDAGGILTFAAVCAGAALLPDLDHPSSMATTRFSWASVAASRVVRPLSALAYRLTRARRDTGRGTHRGLTHTALFAVGTGLAINAASARWGAPVLLGTLFVCIALAIKGSTRWCPARRRW